MKSPGDQPGQTTIHLQQHRSSVSTRNTMAEADRSAHFNINGTAVSTQEIEFKRILKDGDWSTTYLVNIRGQPYVMKVVSNSLRYLDRALTRPCLTTHCMCV